MPKPSEIPVWINDEGSARDPLATASCYGARRDYAAPRALGRNRAIRRSRCGGREFRLLVSFCEDDMEIDGTTKGLANGAMSGV